jgi:hypothetical protein
MNYGRYLGIGTGLAFVYLCDSMVVQISNAFPRLRLSPYLLRAGVVFAFYKMGEYISTYRNMRTNSQFAASIYRNNLYTMNREALGRGFHVMNRRFLPEEREQFIVNGGIQKIGKRLFQYNPATHSDSEEEEAEKVRLLNEGIPPYRWPKIMEKIREDNKQRTEAGELLHIEPFRPSEALDKDGLKFGIRVFRGFDHKNVIA